MLGRVWVCHKNANVENTIEKKVITVDVMWPTYSFASAVDEAATIVYERVIDKSVIDDAMVTYLEFGGETEDLICVYEDIEPVETNGEYIFFLNYHGAALSPMTLLSVAVLTQGKIMPTSEVSALSSDISIEAFLRAIESVLAD